MKNNIAVKVVSVMCACSLLVGCASVKQTAKNAADKVTDTAGNVTHSVTNWASGISEDKFKEGWDYAVGIVGTSVSTAMGSSYITKVTNSINGLKTDINSAMGISRGIAQEAGFAAEKWAADTFNINAVAADTGESAKQLGKNDLASVDVDTSWSEEYSLKYYDNASSTARAQSYTFWEKYCQYAREAKKQGKEALSPEDWMDKNVASDEVNSIYDSLYVGQTRLIPTDQLDDAAKYLNWKATKRGMVDSETQNALAPATRETLDKLADRIKSPSSTESQPLTTDEARAIAELSQKGKFEPSDFGVKLSTIVKPKYLLKQSMKAGITSASIESVLTIAPEIYDIVCKAKKEGKVDKGDLKTTGVDGAIAGSEGFVEGAVSNAIVVACKSGKLGKAYKDVNPSVVGALTVCTVDAIRYGYSLSKGKISPADYGNLVAEEAVVSLLGVGGATMITALLPGIPFVALLGSMAGSMVAATGYEMTKTMVLEVADNGGFADVTSKGLNGTVNVAKNAVKKLDFKNKKTDSDNVKVTTLNDGTIKVSKA